MNILGADVLIFMGVFLIAEAIFSIIYYFGESELPHIFRAIRAVFGAILVWRGAYHAIYKTAGLVWPQAAFFMIVGLCILAGYEVALILESGDNE